MECCFCTNLLLVIGTILAIIYAYFKWNYQYWQKINVPCPTPTFPFGNARNVTFAKQGFFQLLAELYQEYKVKGIKHIGIYMLAKPLYIPIDLELVKQILTKDHNHFVDRGVYYNEKDDPLSAHLFTIEGNKWRTLRAKLTPTFTSGKMKMMFSTLVEVGRQMEKALFKMTNDREALDIKEILARYSTDIIGSCAFGLDCNSFTEPDSKFRKYGHKVFQGTVIDNFKGLFGFLCPDLARKLHVSFIKADINEFFMGVIKDTIKYREEKDIKRNDFMQLLLELKNGSSELGTLTIEEIAAQAFVFFLAGFETSSTTMTFCLFELSKNQDLQEQVRQEIDNILKKYDGEITYDGIKEMKLLGRVVDETLRMYPPVPMLNRICTMPYTVPETDVIIEEKTQVLIPVYGIHHDPELYPDPEIFNPDRFTDQAKAERHPFAFLPFGEGPRNCIGLRFGLMQTNVGLCAVLKNFKLSLNEKTELPLTMDPIVFTLTSKEKILLNSVKI